MRRHNRRPLCGGGGRGYQLFFFRDAFLRSLAFARRSGPEEASADAEEDEEDEAEDPESDDSFPSIKLAARSFNDDHHPDPELTVDFAAFEIRSATPFTACAAAALTASLTAVFTMFFTPAFIASICSRIIASSSGVSCRPPCPCPWGCPPNGPP